MIPLFKVLMTDEAVERASKTLRSGYIGQGPVVEEFEKRLGEVLYAPWDVLTVNSCTSALDLALHLCGVGPGDEVVTTAQTCTASNAPIVTRGATPVWANVDPSTGLIDPKSVGQLIGPKTKAIMAVDWGGAPCDYDRLRSYGLPVIEDAAHAFRATRGGAPIAQSGGTHVCWSMQAIKHLTTVDGGLLKTPEDQVDRARLLRWYGLDRRKGEALRCSVPTNEVGYKYHMNDVCASVGLGNLDRAIHAVNEHRGCAEFYDAELRGLWPVKLPPRNPQSSWWIYTLLVEDRAGFMAFMKERGIMTSPVHMRNDLHPAFRRAGKAPLPTPGLDYFSERHVAIPCGWWLSKDDLCYIAEAVRSWAKQA